VDGRRARALNYVATVDGVSNIWSQPLDGTPSKRLTDFKSDLVFNFDWSRDGRQLVLARATTAGYLQSREDHDLNLRVLFDTPLSPP
jgi:tricorn protease-like protein